MFRRMIFPILLGLAGAAVLISLGVWQLQRLAWKEAVLAEITARIAAAPVDLPENPDPEADRYLPVTVAGRYTGESLRVLVSTKEQGAGYRIISVLETAEGRRIMVDEGYVPVDANADLGPAEAIRVSGNLHWPDEVDSWTPEPDPAEGLFFARDVTAMAAALRTEPTFVIARAIEGAGPRAMAIPVGIEGVPNNHLGYAVQWFGLAVVWVGMTLALLWRIRRRTV